MGRRLLPRISRETRSVATLSLVWAGSVSCTGTPSPNCSPSARTDPSPARVSSLADAGRATELLDADRQVEPPDATDASDPGLPALGSTPALMRLEVAGFSPAVVSLPLGSTSPRPLLIATHGNYDSPEWACEIWREIVLDRGFVLCPRGFARNDSPAPHDIRYQYATSAMLAKEIEAGVVALRAAYGSYLDPGTVIYAGFSQGAIMGVPIVLKNPSHYSRVVLIEGAYGSWTAANARAFAREGGKRILFACGQWGCERQARQSVTTLERAGVDARIVFAKGEGHTYGGAVALGISDEFQWLVEGDPRWSP